MSRWCAGDRALRAALASIVLASAPMAHAQFAAAVTPPRFEFSVEPGDVSRQVLEIANAVAGPASYRVYTADWTMSPDGALQFYDALQPGSCRPWVAIERREVTVAASARMRFRFEVAPPAGTTPRECRFALMLESLPQDVRAATSTFPMSGRIGVIVYARVGDVRAQLRADETAVDTYDGRPTAMLTVSNLGQATGRLAGVLQGRDAAGRAIEMSPESVPILPGQSRRVALPEYRPSTSPQWPLQVHGELEYEGGAQRMAVDASITERKAP